MHTRRSLACAAPRLKLLRALLLGCTSAACLLGTPAPASETGTLRILTYNTYFAEYQNDVDAIADLFLNGDYDVIALQELFFNDTLASELTELMNDAGLGDYDYSWSQGYFNNSGDTALISRLDGELSYGTYGDTVAYQLIDDADSGLPETYVASVHLSSSDESDDRLSEVEGLTEWALSTNRAVILVGDFNAGDVSERGLNSAEQQKLLLQDYLTSQNTFYYTLLCEYTTDQEALDAYIAEHLGESVELDDIPDDLFEDEDYPVADNEPVTLNALKKNFILFQTDDMAESYAPHDYDDGSTTWPSAEEDDANTWPSWDRASIDHLLISRPFAKWYVLVDDADDAYTGVLDDTDVTEDGDAYSDHELVGYELQWVGPVLEYYDEDGEEETRLIWGSEANTWDEDGGVFYLTRNNYRTDVYLGEATDDDGNLLVADLTEEEKTQILDCSSSEERFAAAIAEYCIDDHSFISETLITDDGTVIVDEDAALGDSDATLILDEGGLEISGTEMTELDRPISIEDYDNDGEAYGWIDVDDADASVSVPQAISGEGDFEKRGEGRLVLESENSYTGTTTVSAGTLSVNGSIASSSLTTVADGGTLGGTGTVGDTYVASGGTLAPGNSIGALTVAGDLTFAAGSTYSVEIDADGNSDQVSATGTITIEGGTLELVAGAGTYSAGLSYTILAAAGGVSGSFDSVSEDFAFFDAELDTTSSGISLTLERNTTSFASVAETANQAAAAEGLESLASNGTNALYTTVLNLDTETAASAFDQVSGELHASAVSALAWQAELVQHAVLGNIDPASPRNADGSRVWMQAYGASADLQNDAGHDLDYGTKGALFGLDRTLGQWIVGGFIGGGKGDMDLDASSDHADSDDLHLGLYATRSFGATDLRTGLSWTRSALETDRHVAVSSFSDQLNADYDARMVQLFGQLSRSYVLGQTTLEPSAGLSYLHVSTGDVSETGGDAALALSGADFDATFVELGLAARHSLAGTVHPTQLTSGLRWRHKLAGDAPQIDMAFAGGSSFAVEGADLDDDLISVDLGIDVALGKSSRLHAGYSHQFGENTESGALSARLSVWF